METSTVCASSLYGVLAQELWNKSDSLKNKVHGGSQIFAALRVIDGHVRDRRSDVTNDQRSNEQLRA